MQYSLRTKISDIENDEFTITVALYKYSTQLGHYKQTLPAKYIQEATLLDYRLSPAAIAATVASDNADIAHQTELAIQDILGEPPETIQARCIQGRYGNNQWEEPITACKRMMMRYVYVTESEERGKANDTDQA